MSALPLGSLTSIFWLVTAGADSPLRTSSKEVLPAFLAVERDVKTVVLRSYRHNDETTLSYYISRGSAITLGEPEVAPKDLPVITNAIEGLVDNTGVTSSKVFSDYGIKYVFIEEVPVLRTSVLGDVSEMAVESPVVLGGHTTAG